MSSSLLQQNLPTPLPVSERHAQPAKHDLRKTEIDVLYARIGKCIDEVRNVFGMTLKEFSAELGKNESQIRRQIEGQERPQIEAVMAVQKFQGPMVIALARFAAGVEVDTVIHVRRSA